MVAEVPVCAVGCVAGGVLDGVGTRFGNGKLEIGDLIICKLVLSADCREGQPAQRNKLRLGRNLKAHPLARDLNMGRHCQFLAFSGSRRDSVVGHMVHAVRRAPCERAQRGMRPNIVRPDCRRWAMAAWKAAAIGSAIVMAVAMLGLLGLRETYGVDLDYEVLGQNNGMLMVAVSGTAVVIEG